MRAVRNQDPLARRKVEPLAGALDAAGDWHSRLLPAGTGDDQDYGPVWFRVPGNERVRDAAVEGRVRPGNQRRDRSDQAKPVDATRLYPSEVVSLSSVLVDVHTLNWLCVASAATSLSRVP